VNGATQALADSLTKSFNYIRKGMAEKGEAWLRRSEEWCSKVQQRRGVAGQGIVKYGKGNVL